MMASNGLSLRLLEDVEADLSQMGLSRWRAVAADRGDWMRIVSETKSYMGCRLIG